MKSILIIDDESDIREILSYNLTKEGYRVFTSSNGVEGISIAKKEHPDLILLDVMMPEMDGIEVCEILKEDPTSSDILICFLTARSEDYSQIAGFKAGGDDYVSKPIKPKVLISRIHAILRRNSVQNATAKNSTGLTINHDKHEVSIDGDVIHLPKKEFELLDLLASKPGKVFKRAIILESVWGTDIVVGDRTIDVHIRKLREKIGSEFIRTIKGVGYTFKEK
tara:strand:+ start:87161 stop:87829 length:669 start_codon:yes stop_codon:yes gene_type:complete